jgi:hypothetical protein
VLLPWALDCDGGVPELPVEEALPGTLLPPAEELALPAAPELPPAEEDALEALDCGGGAAELLAEEPLPGSPLPPADDDALEPLCERPVPQHDQTGSACAAWASTAGGTDTAAVAMAIRRSI